MSEVQGKNLVGEYQDRTMSERAALEVKAGDFLYVDEVFLTARQEGGVRYQTVDGEFLACSAKTDMPLDTRTNIRLEVAKVLEGGEVEFTIIRDEPSETPESIAFSLSAIYRHISLPDTKSHGRIFISGTGGGGGITWQESKPNQSTSKSE